MRERSESQHPEESSVSLNSTKISLKTDKKVRLRQVRVTAAATIRPRQGRNCKTNKTCRKIHKPTRQTQIPVTPPPTRDEPHPIYKFRKMRGWGCFSAETQGVLEWSLCYDLTFPMWRLQLWWFLLHYCDTPGIFKMPFAIYLMVVEKHFVHNSMLSIKSSHKEERCFVTCCRASMRWY